MLRPATALGEDRSIKTFVLPCGVTDELRLATAPDEDRDNAINSMEFDDVKLRPAIAPGEDRNYERTAF